MAIKRIRNSGWDIRGLHYRAVPSSGRSFRCSFLSQNSSGTKDQWKNAIFPARTQRSIRDIEMQIVTLVTFSRQ